MSVSLSSLRDSQFSTLTILSSRSPHINPSNNGVQSGLGGSFGNAGGVIFAMIWRFRGSTAGMPWWYARPAVNQRVNRTDLSLPGTGSRASSPSVSTAYCSLCRSRRLERRLRHAFALDRPAPRSLRPRCTSLDPINVSLHLQLVAPQLCNDSCLTKIRMRRRLQRLRTMTVRPAFSGISRLIGLPAEL